MKLVCKSVCVIKFAGSNFANCASGSRVVKPCAHKYRYLMDYKSDYTRKKPRASRSFRDELSYLRVWTRFQISWQRVPDQNWTSSKRFCTHSLHGLCGDVLFRVKVKNYARHDNYFRFAWRAAGRSRQIFSAIVQTQSFYSKHSSICRLK